MDASTAEAAEASTAELRKALQAEVAKVERGEKALKENKEEMDVKYLGFFEIYTFNCFFDVYHGTIDVLLMYY